MAARKLTQADLARILGASDAYVSRLLNKNENHQLLTMVKCAQAMDALVEVRLVQDGGEFVRVMNLDEAIAFDERKLASQDRDPSGQKRAPAEPAKVLPFVLSSTRASHAANGDAIAMRL